MGEYSRIAQGSFACTATKQVVYLPFEPDYVKVTNINGCNYIGAATTSVISLEWASCMQQGDGIFYSKLGAISGTPTGYYYPQSALTIGGAGSGISTFSAGLSFSYGAPIAISGITKAVVASTTPLVTTVTAHGYNDGDIVILEGIPGMQQMAGIPMGVNVISANTFSIPWNTSGSSYTAVSNPGPTYTSFVKKINFPFLYAPGVSIISAIGLGTSTTITCTTNTNLVVGSQVAFRIPPLWGTTQLNSLPNTTIPGSPQYGYVTSVSGSSSIFSSNVVVVNINSSLFTLYTNNMLVTQVPGLTAPQMLSVGDVNTGGWPISNGSALYPSPMVNGARTINGPGIQGAFVNNTRQGFVIGDSILTSGAVGNSTYFWQAMSFDYLSYSSVGVTVG